MSNVSFEKHIKMSTSLVKKVFDNPLNFLSVNQSIKTFLTKRVIEIQYADFLTNKGRT
jgi:hypothetical protein